MGERQYIGCDVMEAAQARIAWVFDNFPRVYVSFSGGKDSTVMLHLAAFEARRRGRKIGLFFVDLEAQYKLTIDHVETCYREYDDCIEPYWLSLPVSLRNAVSQFQPQWLCWDPDARENWVRQPSTWSLTDEAKFPFFRRGMEFEELVPDFGRWYAQGKLCACLVGIRTQESLNRWRTVAGHGTKFEGIGWTNWMGEGLWNVYPIYDWQTEDLWTFHGKFGGAYNRLYDRMHQAGLTIHQMRICQPYGDDQRKGLWLYQVIEPETWGRVVARVNGANQGALYAQETGNVLGRIRVTRPPGHTWESFSRLLLETMPAHTRDHYKDKIATFIRWYELKGIAIQDEGDPKVICMRWWMDSIATLSGKSWGSHISLSS
jgi:predicted phosphoadenosine phosphosulfate sulfurtransferase